MKLKQIVIKNFRNLAVVRLDLDDQGKIIEGANMSGKTNTLNAIHWGFTGVTMDGSSDNRANFPIDKECDSFEVGLLFEGFKFFRVCNMVEGTPTVSIWVDGELASSIKSGEAQFHKKLGLTDMIIQQPKGFDIIKFLLNPLYFEEVTPKALRQFFYLLSNTDFYAIANAQNNAIRETLKRYPNCEPYFLIGSIETEKKALKKTIDACKNAISLFPEISGKAHALQTKTEKELKELESREALIQKYALAVSKKVNEYYQKAMGMKVRIMERGVGEDVYKDVCYPILPKSNLPFNQGSYAEKTCVAIAFVTQVAKTYKIPTLPLLVDNFESLDKNSEDALVDFIRENDAQYIGAKVQYKEER